MKKTVAALFTLTALVTFAANAQAQTVHEVKMVDISPTEFAFEPASITVAPGDIVRWINAGTMGQPHNVDFRAPDASQAPGAAGDPGIVGTISPFLLTAGDTWEVTIDERFVPGVTQPYVCTPHELMGMKGTITVKAEEKDN